MPPALRLELVRKRAEAQDVLSLEFADPHGGVLPGYTPGAHIDLHLPGGLVRQYSLLGEAGAAPRTYRVAVGRPAASRGGSAAVHDALRVGDLLGVGRPRNFFALDESATAFRFIAGGIGITPILCMLQWCARAGRPWRLLYCAQSRQRAAFVDEVRSAAGGAVGLHFDNESGGAPPSLAPMLAAPQAGEHLYCCGPTPMMDAVLHASAHWPSQQRHFERFSAPPPAPEGTDSAFTVLLHQRGMRVDVAPGQSILEALEAQGLDIAHGCRSGGCGCCEVAVLDGVPDHRDTVLSADERDRNRSMMICVSRARTRFLTLDL